MFRLSFCLPRDLFGTFSHEMHLDA